MKFKDLSSPTGYSTSPYFGWKLLWSNGRYHIYLLTCWLRHQKRYLAKLALSSSLVVTMLAAPLVTPQPTGMPDTIYDYPIIVQETLASWGLGVDTAQAAPPDQFQVNTYTTSNQR